MKVVKYICDKCGKEISGSVMAIVPEILDENNAELLDNSFDDPIMQSQVDRHYCRRCVERVFRFANSLAAMENPEFKEAVEDMISENKAEMSKKNRLNRDEVTVLLEKGVKVKDIAEQYCVTSGAVYAFMKSHHIQRPKVMKEKTKEPVICTEAIAKKCYYGGKTGGSRICDYLEIEGHRRPCKHEACTEYREK